MKSFKEILNESWKKKRFRNQLEKTREYNRLERDEQVVADAANKRFIRLFPVLSHNEMDDLARKSYLKSAFRASRESGLPLNPLDKQNINRHYKDFTKREDAMVMVGPDLNKIRKNKQRRLENIISRIKK